MSPHFRRLSPLKPERLGAGYAQTLADTCAQSLGLTPFQVSQEHEGASHAAFVFSQRDFPIVFFWLQSFRNESYPEMDME